MHFDSSGRDEENPMIINLYYMIVILIIVMGFF